MCIGKCYVFAGKQGHKGRSHNKFKGANEESRSCSKHGEVTTKGGKDRTVTKEHPWGLKCKRPNFMWKEHPSWTWGWHHQNDAIDGGKVQNVKRTHGSKEATEPGRMGLGRSAQADRTSPFSRRFGSPFLECEDDATLSTWRSRHSQGESHSPERPSTS
jgi:hypothetical protein